MDSHEQSHAYLQHEDPTNLRILYDANGYPVAVPVGRKSESDDEDDESEFRPQYKPLPAHHSFLSAQAITTKYTEIQVGLSFDNRTTRIPPCDVCHSRRKDGRVPVVYNCLTCLRSGSRRLCKRCCRKEFSDPSALHKPDHVVAQWQPSWGWKFEQRFTDPLVSIEMEYFVQTKFPDDPRTLTFTSREHFRDRGVRIFVPASSGLNHVEVELELKSLKSEKRHRDVFERSLGLLTDQGSKEIAGTIGLSTYPTALTSHIIPPRSDIPRGFDKQPKTNKYPTTDFVDIKRGDNPGKTYTLNTYVTNSNSAHHGIELLLQDKYFDSDEFHARPFTWKLKSVVITHVPAPAPNFASRGQIELHRRAVEKERREDWERKRKGIQEKMEAGQAFQDRLREQRKQQGKR